MSDFRLLDEVSLMTCDDLRMRLEENTYNIHILTQALHRVLSGAKEQPSSKVQLLLSAGADVLQDVNGRNALQQAAGSGCIEHIEQVVSDCPESCLPELFDHSPTTRCALYVATSRKHAQCAIKILDKMIHSLPPDHVEQYLLPWGCRYGLCPLNSAAEHNMFTLADIFLEAVREEYRLQCMKYTLKAALMNGNVEYSRKYLNFGISINNLLPGTNITTPILLAIQQQNTELVKMLLDEFNADAESQNILERAVDYSSLPVVKLLIEDYHLNASGPLISYAVTLGEIKHDMLDYLIETGADVNERNPLVTAVLNGDVYVVRKLVKHGADVNAHYDSDIPLLNIVAAKSDPDILTCFLSVLGRYQHSINFSSLKCGTPLTVAARFALPENVEQLIRHGADPNVKDFTGQTPLVCALGGATCSPLKGSEAVLKLLQGGANIRQSVSIQGNIYSPLDYAVASHIIPLVKMLRHAGSYPCQDMRWRSQTIGSQYSTCTDEIKQQLEFVSNWYRKSEMILYLDEIRNKIPSLMSLSIISVRKCLDNSHIQHCIDNLAIPQYTKDQVNLSELSQIWTEILEDYTQWKEQGNKDADSDNDPGNDRPEIKAPLNYITFLHFDFDWKNDQLQACGYNMFTE